MQQSELAQLLAPHVVLAALDVVPVGQSLWERKVAQDGGGGGGAGGVGVQYGLHTSSQTNGSCPQLTIFCLLPSAHKQYPELPGLMVVVQKPFPV